MEQKQQKPLVYSCSGCSNLAMIAHDIALDLDRNQIAEMSCVSGVAGKVPSIQAKVQSGRDILVIDGCSLGCTQACLVQCGIEPTRCFDISSFGISKHDKWVGSISEYGLAIQQVYEKLERYGYHMPDGFEDHQS